MNLRAMVELIIVVRRKEMIANFAILGGYQTSGDRRQRLISHVPETQRGEY